MTREPFGTPFPIGVRVHHSFLAQTGLEGVKRSHDYCTLKLNEYRIMTRFYSRETEVHMPMVPARRLQRLSAYASLQNNSRVIYIRDGLQRTSRSSPSLLPIHSTCNHRKCFQRANDRFSSIDRAQASSIAFSPSRFHLSDSIFRLAKAVPGSIPSKPRFALPAARRSPKPRTTL